MRTHKKSGFTIIEVMLFLAITGALTVAILVGSGVAIGQQRYRDSVASFKGLIQEQYSQIANVINSDPANPDCSRSGSALTFNIDSQQARGTSECLVMGRFLFIDGTTVIAHNLVGEPDGAVIGGDDVAALQQFGYALQSPETHEVHWGARIVEPESNNDSLASVLIVRSPVSGAILTYVMNGDHRSTIMEMIQDANMVQRDFCVDSDGGTTMSSRFAVRIGARASSQSAVEIPLEGEAVCD